MSISATVTINITPNASGGATGNGAGTFTGGTDRYRGAHGHFTFAGSQTATAQDFTLDLGGTATY